MDENTGAPIEGLGDDTEETEHGAGVGAVTGQEQGGTGDVSRGTNNSSTRRAAGTAGRTGAKAQTPAKGLPKTVRIILEENDKIPPTGQFVGLNGKGYIIRPGEAVDVPEGVLGILKDAIESAPIRDPQTQKVIGHRDARRLPYRVLGSDE